MGSLDNDLQNKADFSIDDAFSENSEDKIRLYSHSSETAPLTETIYEEQEPPDFDGSSLALSPSQSPDTSFSGSLQAPPVIKTKPILKNPTLAALKAKEDKDVSHQSHYLELNSFCFVFSQHLKTLCL